MTSLTITLYYRAATVGLSQHYHIM